MVYIIITLIGGISIVNKPDNSVKQHSCCFTGHRPEKLNVPENEVIAALHREITIAINDGFVTFISGMARGVDIWAAEIVLELKAAGNPLQLICASPFEGFERSWSTEWQRRYNDILAAADLVRFICPSYNRACFQIRNKWMVDGSARVIAAYNGEAGGTRNTIMYAEKHGVTVYHVLKF